MGTETQKVIRALLDTNVFLSALVLRGPTNQLVSQWQEEKFCPVICREILEEYLRVLAYPKFQLSAEEIKRLVEREFLPYAHPVKLKEIPPVIRQDPSDDIFLACALAGRCHYLVTGDHHLLALKTYKGIPIVPVKTFSMLP